MLAEVWVCECTRITTTTTTSTNNSIIIIFGGIYRYIECRRQRRRRRPEVPVSLLALRHTSPSVNTHRSTDFFFTSFQFFLKHLSVSVFVFSTIQVLRWLLLICYIIESRTNEHERNGKQSLIDLSCIPNTMQTVNEAMRYGWVYCIHNNSRSDVRRWEENRIDHCETIDWTPVSFSVR